MSTGRAAAFATKRKSQLTSLKTPKHTGRTRATRGNIILFLAGWRREVKRHVRALDLWGMSSYRLLTDALTQGSLTCFLEGIFNCGSRSSSADGVRWVVSVAWQNSRHALTITKVKNELSQLVPHYIIIRNILPSISRYLLIPICQSNTSCLYFPKLTWLEWLLYIYNNI